MTRRHNALGRAGWAARIADIFRRSQLVPFEIGDALILAKNEIPKGEWEEFVVHDLGRSKSWSKMYMRIAAKPQLRKDNMLSLLPTDVVLLDTIAGLDDDTLDLRLSDGTINPEMGRNDLKAAARREKQQRLRDDPPPLPQGRYRTIYADPPWDFEAYSDNGEGRAPEYATMPTAEICARPVADLAADDCALFLWVVPWMAADAYRVISAWGFSFSTVAFVWVKQGALGKGYWTRQRAEYCLLATKGRPTRLDEGVDQVIDAPRGRHSAKPEETYARIERLVAGPYLELFARQRRDGWDAWGDEVSPDPGPGQAGVSDRVSG